MASQRRRPGSRSGRAALFDLLRGLGRLAVVGLPVALAPSPSSAALVDWLVLLVDTSASIDRDEYRLQHEAYVSVLQDPGIGALLEGAKVAVVEFATAPEVVVEWTDDPKEVALAYAGHTRQVAGPGRASTTGIARALGLALDMLEDKAGRKVIDISGDGPDNVDWISAVWSQRERARGLRVEINGLAIPTAEEPGIDIYYAEHVITGFLEISREHRDFERALLMKMHIEIAGRAAHERWREASSLHIAGPHREDGRDSPKMTSPCYDRLVTASGAMAEPARKLWTLDEVLDFDDGTDTRYELIGGEIVAMAPASGIHGALAARLAILFGRELSGRGEVALRAGIVPASPHAYYQADLAVTCAPITGQPFVGAPRVIAEVLSPSTATTDYLRKLPDYRGIPSVQDILLVSSTEPRIEHWGREGDGWKVQDLQGEGVRPQAFDLRVALADLYDGVCRPKRGSKPQADRTRRLSRARGARPNR